MCEYCGCRQIEPLAELMDEHLRLLDEAGEVRRAVSVRDPERATTLLRSLGAHLDRHVRREEDGVFAALRRSGEYLDELAELEQEHRDFHDQIDSLDPTDPSFAERFAQIFAHLTDHIDKEDLGIFPVSVVTLGTEGWDLVARVHGAEPSFLHDQGS